MTRPANKTATVGQVLNKIMSINPDLGPADLIRIMKDSVISKGGRFEDGFAKQDVIDEARALELAKETLS